MQDIHVDTLSFVHACDKGLHCIIIHLIANVGYSLVNSEKKKTFSNGFLFYRVTRVLKDL